jgi:hypothetical protein
MYDGKVDSYYIDLPLLAKIQMPLSIQVEPYLLVGSGVGFSSAQWMKMMLEVVETLPSTPVPLI